MKRNTRAGKAQETLQIIERGAYNVEGRAIVLKRDIATSIEATQLYRTDEFYNVLKDVETKLESANHKTEISVANISVLKAASSLVLKGGSVGCLNFASAKNPGGGFLGGAQAQEESIALSSTLYPTLMKHFEMYEYNRSRSTFLYSDYMIYSPGVMVIRNDDGDLLTAPYSLSFITSPAVNIGAMKNNRTEEISLAENVMMQRMDKVLGLFMYHNIEHLLLGAWGCGVFQNDPEDIATYFSRYLLNNSKYSKAFKSVTFAILSKSKDGQNLRAFENIFRTNDPNYHHENTDGNI